MIAHKILGEAITPPTSPAFKAWFAGSQVVDADGNPLLCFHVTKEPQKSLDFNKAKSDLSALGIHFGTKEQAEWRSGQYDFHGSAPNTIPVYLNIKNPLEVNHMCSFAPDRLAWHLIENTDILTEEQYEHLMDDEYMPTEYEIGRKLVKILQKHGYDGLKYKNEREGEGYSWVAFRPEQAKSALSSKYTNHPNLGESVVNSLIEDYDPDLDEVSPESVSHQAMPVEFDLSDPITDVPWVRDAVVALAHEVGASGPCEVDADRHGTNGIVGRRTASSALVSITVRFENVTNGVWMTNPPPGAPKCQTQGTMTYYIYKDKKICAQLDDRKNIPKVQLSNGAVAMRA